MKCLQNVFYTKKQSSVTEDVSDDAVISQYAISEIDSAWNGVCRVRRADGCYSECMSEAIKDTCRGRVGVWMGVTGDVGWDEWGSR